MLGFAKRFRVPESSDGERHCAAESWGRDKVVVVGGGVPLEFGSSFPVQIEGKKERKKEKVEIISQYCETDQQHLQLHNLAPGQ